jgi:hypothetical protein
MIASFDLWMSKRAHDVFALVINLLGNYWMPKHIINGLFEIFKTSGHNLAISSFKAIWLDQKDIYLC